MGLQLIIFARLYAEPPPLRWRAILLRYWAEKLSLVELDSQQLRRYFRHCCRLLIRLVRLLLRFFGRLIDTLATFSDVFFMSVYAADAVFIESLMLRQDAIDVILRAIEAGISCFRCFSLAAIDKARPLSATMSLIDADWLLSAFGCFIADFIDYADDFAELRWPADFSWFQPPPPLYCRCFTRLADYDFFSHIDIDYIGSQLRGRFDIDWYFDVHWPLLFDFAAIRQSLILAEIRCLRQIDDADSCFTPLILPRW